jgi:hydroxypyruvate reductase
MIPPHADLQALRRHALEIFSSALKAVDAKAALQRKVHLSGDRLTVFDTTYNLNTHGAHVYAVAIGKAAVAMAAALDEILGGRLTAGIVAAPSQVEGKVDSLLQQLVSVGQVSEEEARTKMFREVVRSAVEHGEQRALQNPLALSTRWKVFAGGHPLPDKGSLEAARAAVNLVRRAEAERALLIFLISGGGSAIFELPRDASLTLEDLRAANRALVLCGATIAEVNSVRRAFSAVKGGRLSALAPHAEQVCLIVSDTNPGEEYAVASGPTFEPPLDAPDPHEVISRYHLEKNLTPSILSVISAARDEERKPVGFHVRHHLLMDNRSAIEAARQAAHARGLVVELAPDIIEQPIAEGCAQLLSRLYAARAENSGQAFCLISGGEFACPVRGQGTGGRNAETVLRCAIDLDERRSQAADRREPAHTVILSAGTDGIDGNSPAAGAIADETSIERARQHGLDARTMLEQSDAYTFFRALNDTIITGATGTNVRDLRIMLAL